MTKFAILATAIASVGLWAAMGADDKGADEKSRNENKKVPIGEVPENLVKVAKEALPGAEWTGAEINYDLGKHPSVVVYEIAGKKDGKEVEIDVRADGSIEEIEDVIDDKDAPKVAVDLLISEYPEFKVKKTEKSTRHHRSGSKAVWYEFKGTTKEGDPLDVEITEDGKYFVAEAD